MFEEAEQRRLYEGYTFDEYEKLIQLIEELNQLTTNELKEECRLNDQKVSGIKKELVERVADGRVKGAIPRCPQCTGGKLRFNPRTGNYKCPGYMDDEDFVKCNKVYKSLIRRKWIIQEKPLKRKNKQEKTHSKKPKVTTSSNNYSQLLDI